jgi:hypothetical protein
MSDIMPLTSAVVKRQPKKMLWVVVISLREMTVSTWTVVLMSSRGYVFSPRSRHGKLG